MTRGSRSIGLIVHPASYPAARLVWTEKIQNEEDKYGRKISLDRDFWVDFATICEKAATRIDASKSQTLTIALSVISSVITDEIAAEDKRVRNRDIYDSFLDFVVATMKRTDFDKARKGQIIHDTACLIKLL